MWLVGKGTYRTRTKNNNADPSQGSFFNGGETWYGIMASYVHSANHYPSRTHNWHDEPVSGYTWGSVSPVAWDCFVPGTVDFDSGYPTALILEYASGCAGTKGGAASAPTHFNVPVQVDDWNFFFYKIKFAADCTGSVQLYVQNSSTSTSDGPVINLTNVRTLNPTSGFFPGVQFWQGFYVAKDYTSGPDVLVDHMLSMWGQSWQQAWDDNPTLVETVFNNTVAGKDPSATTITSLNTANFPLPQDIVSQVSDPPGGGTGGGSSFPTTSVITAFTHADENPLSISSAWAGPTAPSNSKLKLVSNKVLSSASGGSSSYYATSLGPDSEVFVDVSTLPGTGQGVCLDARIQSPNSPSTSSYRFCYHPGIGFRYYKLTPGETYTQLGSTSTTHTLANGEQLGFSVSGSSPVTLQGYWGAAGAYTAVGSTTDSSSPITSPGYIGIALDDTTAIVDNFGGGTVGATVSNPLANSTAPVVSGTTTVASTLTVSNGVWTGSPTGYAYQWQRDTANNGVFVNIAAATATTYVLVAADSGNKVRCVVTAHNDTDTVAANSNAVGLITTPSSPSLNITITQPTSGVVVAGIVTFQASVAAPAGYSYVQWRVDGQEYGGRLTTSPFQMEWKAAKAGTHAVTATVVSPSGASVTASVSLSTGMVPVSHLTSTITPK